MLSDQIALGRQRRLGQPRGQLASQRRGVLPAADDRDEALQQHQRLGRRQRRLILDRIGDATQQVGVRDRGPQRRGQLRDGQRESARHVRQYPILIGLIGHAGSIWQIGPETSYGSHRVKKLRTGRPAPPRQDSNTHRSRESLKGILGADDRPVR